MPRMNIWLCFVLLASCCDGRTDGEEERPTVKGSHHLSHLESGFRLEPSGPARRGLLTFRHDQQGDLSSTKGELFSTKRLSKSLNQYESVVLKLLFRIT